MLRRLQQATGLVPEARAEGIALVDPSCALSWRPGAGQFMRSN